MMVSTANLHDQHEPVAKSVFFLPSHEIPIAGISIQRTGIHTHEKTTKQL